MSARRRRPLPARTGRWSTVGRSRIWGSSCAGRRAAANQIPGRQRRHCVHPHGGPLVGTCRRRGHQPDTAVAERSRRRGLDTCWAVRAQYGEQPGSAAPSGTVGRRWHHCRAHHLVRVDRPYALNLPLARFWAGRTRESNDHPRTASPTSSELHDGASDGQPRSVAVRRVMSRSAYGHQCLALMRPVTLTGYRESLSVNLGPSRLTRRRPATLPPLHGLNVDVRGGTRLGGSRFGPCLLGSRP